jgi:hypothetical protein
MVGVAVDKGIHLRPDETLPTGANDGAGVHVDYELAHAVNDAERSVAVLAAQLWPSLHGHSAPPPTVEVVAFPVTASTAAFCASRSSPSVAAPMR